MNDSLVIGLLQASPEIPQILHLQALREARQVVESLDEALLREDLRRARGMDNERSETGNRTAREFPLPLRLPLSRA